MQLLEIERSPQEPHGAVADAANSPAIALDGAGDDCADHRIETGAIATTGQQPDGFSRRFHVAPALHLHMSIGAAEAKVQYPGAALRWIKRAARAGW